MTDGRVRRTPRDDELLFVPLGGVGEIGKNVALYGHAGAWIMVDLGMTFGDETTPGIDLIFPDIGFAEAQGSSLLGLVLTHAHEDHVGAIPYLRRKFGCPVYATPFTAAFVRRKLTEEGIGGEIEIRELAQGSRFRLGPFDLEYVTMAHSIPEPNALAIRTPAGTLLHTGDWKLDPDPVVGPPTDEARLRALGDEGVLAMMCDSTNATVDGSTRSEASLLDSIAALIGERDGRVVFTCFASNVARLRTIAAAAQKNGRRVALVGRSLRRMSEIARQTGYLAGTPNFLGEEHVGFLPREEVVLLCTGSQGEPQAAMSRIAGGTHPNVVLDPGDTIVFSSRTIPGNERAVDRLQNLLIRQGLELITNRDRHVHVSGHPARDELARMYEWVRPRIAVPVHGEPVHLHAHCTLARALGVPQTVEVANGSVVRFARGTAEVVGEVPAGRLTYDGRQLVPVDGEGLRARRRMLGEGAALVTLVVDSRGELLADPQVSIKGVSAAGEADGVAAEVGALVAGAVTGLSAPQRRNDAALRDVAQAALRRALKGRYGKRPVTDVHLVRLAR